MTEHWCKEHKTVYFKKGNMKGFAHPILDDNGESTGKWCNEPKHEPPATTSPTLQPNAPQSPQGGQGTALVPKASTSPPVKTEMTPGDWAEKDRITRKSIERQTALNAAVELAKNAKVEITTADIIRTAHSFEAYLAGVPVDKEVLVAEKSLVEEAKKLGATEEIKKGGKP